MPNDAHLYVSRLTKSEKASLFIHDAAFPNSNLQRDFLQAVQDVCLDRLIRADGCLTLAHALSLQNGEEELRAAIGRAYYCIHHCLRTMALWQNKWDPDGHEYVDYAGGHGALLLGHNPPAVVAAVEQQLARGTHYGACHELELRWGQLVQRLMPSAERVRFTASGTEATLLAVRLARAFTGRRKIVRFLGHFHGWHDHMAFGVTGNFDGSPTPGVLPSVADDVLLAPPNDVDATAAIVRQDDIAAVIVEPTGASWGQLPLRPEFLTALRQMTAERGVLLIFDEVISGFRCAPGGAQQVYDIRPDLTTLAKIVAGGLPGGAVVGRRDVLDWLDFAAATDAKRAKIPHQGTFNANPLSAAAGIATLEIVATQPVCERANAYAARLREALQRVVVDERLSWAVYGTFSGFHIFMNPAREPITPADIEAGLYDHRTLKAVDRRLVHLLRVGMLFEGPGVPKGKVVADPVSTLDLPATFCDYAGVSLPGKVHSRSLRPLIETDTAQRDFALSEWDLRASRCGVDLALRTVRTKTRKLTLEKHSGAGELYDLAEDPHEMDNRFGDPAYAAVQRELMDMIASRPDDACAPLPQIGMA